MLTSGCFAKLHVRSFDAHCWTSTLSFIKEETSKSFVVAALSFATGSNFPSLLVYQTLDQGSRNCFKLGSLLMQTV